MTRIMPRVIGKKIFSVFFGRLIDRTPGRRQASRSVVMPGAAVFLLVVFSLLGLPLSHNDVAGAQDKSAKPGTVPNVVRDPHDVPAPIHRKKPTTVKL
ncbi:MAG: hypothetical protein ACERKU_09615, partial [Nitrospirota bacterium]